MKVYTQRYVPAHTTAEWTSDRCDICGLTRDDVEGPSREFADWFSGEFNSYAGLDDDAIPIPLGGSLVVAADEQYDVCGPCFREKLLPFFAAAGRAGHA